MNSAEEAEVQQRRYYPLNLTTKLQREDNHDHDLGPDDRPMGLTPGAGLVSLLGEDTLNTLV